MGEVIDFFSGEPLHASSASPAPLYEERVEAIVVSDIRAFTDLGSVEADVKTAQMLALIFKSRLGGPDRITR